MYDCTVGVSQTLSVIAGRYRLESLIGEGGMASVWRAKDLTLARRVAVKLLFERDDRDHEALVARFLREARIAAAVQHRNVIHIVDFGTTETGQPYMVMELLEGETLGDRLHRHKRLDLSEAVHISSMMLRGLAAVHDAGIIHRDLKPDNIYLKEENGVLFPKILDFGISRSVEPQSGRRSALTTKEGIIVGTPEYMSPEQARGIKEIDRRTDIYSMGVIMFQALTGTLPFTSENVGDLIIKIVTGSPPKIRELNPELPAALAEVITRAMAREPAERFVDATAMQQALVAAAEASMGDSVRRSLSDSPPATIATSTSRMPRNPTPLLSREFALNTDEVRIDTRDPITLPRAPTPAGPAKSQLRTSDFSELMGKPRRQRKIVAGVAMAVALVGAVAWSLSGESAAPAPTVVTPLASATANPPAPAPPAHRSITLTNVPRDATITVDGVAMPGSNFELPNDSQARTILVSAPGKTPWQVVYLGAADRSYEVTLADATPAGAHRAAAARKAKRPAATHKPGGPGALRHLDF